ncbi:MAG: DUF4097 family beta strand repeat protein [Ignavibacteriae bacterium]|nr:DUF4097 family beta strand repeat protein [Ignavibacteriota bacterium]
MNTTLMFRIFPLLCLITLIFSPFASAQKFERKVEKHFEVQANPTVRVESKFGPVTIKGTESSIVDVKVHITVEDDDYENAKERAEDVDVVIDGSRNEVRVEVDWDGSRSNSGKQSMNASIVVSVPKRSVLDIANKFGSITVADVEGSVSVQAQFGSIEITRCANVEAKNSFGNTTLGSIKGAFKVESKNGKVRAYDVPGGEISNAFGAIEVSDASGPVSLLGRMGSITAKNIPGGRIQNSYGSTAVSLVRDFTGVIEAKTRFGDVESDYPLQPRNNNRETRYGPTPEDLIGRVGNGSGKLSVLNEFGDITIRKR